MYAEIKISTRLVFIFTLQVFLESILTFNCTKLICCENILILLDSVMTFPSSPDCFSPSFCPLFSSLLEPLKAQMVLHIELVLFEITDKC